MQQQNAVAHYSTNRLTDAQGNFLCPLHFMLIDKDFPKVTGLKLLEGCVSAACRRSRGGQGDGTDYEMAE